jgi:hypothetical protein
MLVCGDADNMAKELAEHFTLKVVEDPGRKRADTLER